MSEQWYCPKCGPDVAVVHWGGAYGGVRCAECKSHAQSEPPAFVTVMRQCIAELEAKSARQTASFEAQWHLHRQATAVRKDEIAALKAELDRRRFGDNDEGEIAALKQIANSAAQEEETRTDANQFITQQSRIVKLAALRDAGYLKEEGE